MTARQHYEVLFERHGQNPILSAADWPYPAHTVFNAGATQLADGTTLLLCRVEDRRGHFSVHTLLLVLCRAGCQPHV